MLVKGKWKMVRDTKKCRMGERERKEERTWKEVVKGRKRRREK